MNEILSNIDVFIETALESLGLFGPILGSLLIMIESILPILPISIFITLNFYAFGHILGFAISFILTVVGCNISFYLSRKILTGRMNYLTKKFTQNKILKLIKKFSSLKLKHLAILMAFPFTPAFLINIFAGISDIKHHKFLIATLIAKPFMVYFWGYVGTSFLESFKDPENFIKIGLMIIIAYIVSSIVNKKFDLD